MSSAFSAGSMIKVFGQPVTQPGTRVSHSTPLHFRVTPGPLRLLAALARLALPSCDDEAQCSRAAAIP